MKTKDTRDVQTVVAAQVRRAMMEPAERRERRIRLRRATGIRRTARKQS